MKEEKIKLMKETFHELSEINLKKKRNELFESITITIKIKL